MVDLFGYTQTDNVRVDTKPTMVNQRPDMRAAQAFNDISNILQTGMKAYGNIQEEQKKNSLIEASNEANIVHRWYNEEINKTVDPYQQKDLLQQYIVALDSIEQGAELEDKYKKSFVDSNKNFIGEQQRVIGKKVLAQQIADTDEGINNLVTSLVGADPKEVASVLKDTTVAYTNLGVSKEQAADKLFGTFIEKRIEAFSIDPLYSDFSNLENSIEEFVKSFDPKLTNKELHYKAKELLKGLKEEQKGLAKAHLETYLASEKITMSQFEAEADNLKHAFTPLELSNMKEEKANNVYSLKITRKAREEAELNDRNSIFRRDLKAILKDPEAPEKTIKAFLDEAKKIDGMTDIEATSQFNIWKAARDNKELKTRTEAQKKEEKAKKDEATRVVNDIKSKTTTKDGMSPQLLGGYIALKNGSIISKEDQKFFDKYTFKWEIENSPNKLTKTINKTSNAYIGTGAEEAAIKEVMSLTIDNFYNNEQFSADGILKIYKNHDIKGNIASFITKDLNNPQTAAMAVQKVKEMRSIDDISVQTMLGDKLYYKATALEGRITKDKDGNPIIMPNDLRDVNKLVYDAQSIPVDTSVFDEAVKENLHLFKYKNEFKLGVAITGDAETVLENIREKVKQEFPAPGIQLTGYKGINLTEDDIDILKNIPTELKKLNPNATGIAYNPVNDTFYFSAVGATYYSPITRTTEDGTEVAVNKINGAYGVVSILQEKIGKAYKEKYGEGLLYDQLKIVTNPGQALKNLSDKLLSLNPKSGGPTLMDKITVDEESFKKTNLGKLWQRVKDGFSGLQASEVETTTYAKEMETLKKNEPVKSNKEATDVVQAITSITGNKKEVKDLQKTMGVTVNGVFDNKTATAAITKLEEKYHVFANSTEAKNAGMYLTGEKAVKELQKYSDKPLPEKYKNIAREEGFVNGLYKDDKNVITFGLGQTQEHIFKNPIEAIKDHEDKIKKVFKNYNKLDASLQEELLSLAYRGDMQSTMSWVSEFKKGNYFNAALDLLDHQEYYKRQKIKGLDGVEKRLEKAAKTFIAYEYNLDKKVHAKLIDSLLNDIKEANKQR